MLSFVLLFCKCHHPCLNCNTHGCRFLAHSPKQSSMSFFIGQDKVEHLVHEDTNSSFRDFLRFSFLPPLCSFLFRDPIIDRQELIDPLRQGLVHFCPEPPGRASDLCHTGGVRRRTGMKSAGAIEHEQREEQWKHGSMADRQRTLQTPLET